MSRALSSRTAAQIDSALLRALWAESSPDRQTRECGCGDACGIDFEEAPQMFSVFAAAKSVGTERGQTARQPGSDLIGNDFHIIGSRDDRHVTIA